MQASWARSVAVTFANSMNMSWPNSIHRHDAVVEVAVKWDLVHEVIALFINLIYTQPVKHIDACQIIDGKFLREYVW